MPRFEPGLSECKGHSFTYHILLLIYHQSIFYTVSGYLLNFLKECINKCTNIIEFPTPVLWRKTKTYPHSFASLTPAKTAHLLPCLPVKSWPGEVTEPLCKLKEEELSCCVCPYLVLVMLVSICHVASINRPHHGNLDCFSPSQSVNHKPMLRLGALWYFHICLTPWVGQGERIQNNTGNNETKMTFSRSGYWPYLGTCVSIPFFLFILWHSCKIFFWLWHIWEEQGVKKQPSAKAQCGEKGFHYKFKRCEFESQPFYSLAMWLGEGHLTLWNSSCCCCDVCKT